MMLKPVFILFTVLVTLNAAVLLNDDLNGEWESFKTKFNKKYSNPLIEASRRLVWERNARNIQQHNIEFDLGKKSFRQGVNQFSDLTHDEFKSQYLGVKVPVNKTRQSEYTFRAPLNLERLPEHVDWRTKGFVTPVKNQGRCGSCWAFSTTGSLEGQHSRVMGKLVSLSEQQLMDCSGSYGNHGCEGGMMDNAFNYIKDKGIEGESAYPYTASDKKCVYNKKRIVASCKGFVDVKHGDEDDLQKAVATVGPISVAIDASHGSFQRYSGGVYDEPMCSSTNIDHGVLVVGYGEENGKKYWLVKNSWGSTWGDRGYIKMSRGKNNQCAIALAASYPLV